jgi:hypothetical protein
LKRGLAKGCDLATLDILKNIEIVDKKFDRVVDGTFKFIRNNVEITGHIDGITIENNNYEFVPGLPVCIRNIFDENHFETQFIKYLGQLAMMMDFKEVEDGVLIISSMKDVKMYVVKKLKNKYYCNNEIVDLDGQYKTFEKVKKDYAKN